MLSPSFLVWDVDYPLYTCGSIFIIGLIIWQVKKRRQKLILRPSKNCCQHHRRVKHSSRERTSRAKKSFQKEAERLQKLVSLMKSQGWLPREGNVRRILCADPSCQICNDMALEIQQLLVGKNNQISPTLSKASQSSSHLRRLSTSSVPFEQSRKLGFQNSRELLQAPGPTLSQLTDKKSFIQSAFQSTGRASTQQCWPDHLLSVQVPHLFQDARTRSSSSLEDSEISSNWKEKAKSAPEVDLENTMTFFSHWINPEVKDQRHEEPVIHSKSETRAKPRTKEVEKSPTLTRRSIKRAKDAEAQPPHTAKGQHLTFLDAHTVSSSNAPSRAVNPGALATRKAAPKSDN